MICKKRANFTWTPLTLNFFNLANEKRTRFSLKFKNVTNSWRKIKFTRNSSPCTEIRQSLQCRDFSIEAGFVQQKSHQDSSTIHEPEHKANSQEGYISKPQHYLKKREKYLGIDIFKDGLNTLESFDQFKGLLRSNSLDF